MKQINFLLFILFYFIFLSCAQEPLSDNLAQTDSRSTETGETSNSIFKELSDKVKDLHNEDSSRLTRQLTKDDGTNAFDDVIKEIQGHDAESGGQVSSMIEMILDAAGEEIDIDMTEMMKENLERTHEWSKQLEDATGRIEELVPRQTAENLYESLQDFIKTGGENGGVETILEEFVNYEKRINPESSNTEWMKKMQEILQNSEKSFEKEVEQLLIEALKNQNHNRNQN